MTKQNHIIDFSTVLGAAVHDMKNSLGLLRQTIEELSKTISQENSKAKVFLAIAHYESARLNTGVVQLLSLYRAELENLPINVDECFVEVLLEELVANNESYIQHKNKRLTVEQEDGLSWFIDADLVQLLLNDMLVNATRYSENAISLKCFKADGFLVFEIEDDGPGYPDNMLQATKSEMPDFDISQGRTGLGLFFARMIALAHSNANRLGIIELENNGSLGGSVFRLKLP
jgi:signal transduction histidine kinase